MLSQMGSVGVSMLCSAGLPCQQAQNASLENSCDKSDITLRSTGVCLSGESAPVHRGSVCQLSVGCRGRNECAQGGNIE